MPFPARPITVALVDDYDVVLKGLAHLFDDYRDRVIVAEIDANAPVSDSVDVVLYDSFAQPEADHVEIAELLRNPRARRVVVYTWNFHPDLIEIARNQGVHGYLSKTLSAAELVTAIEAVHAGARIFNDQSRVQRSEPARTQPAGPRLAGQARGHHRPRIGDPRAHHAGQEQRRDRAAHLPEPEHGEVLHPVGLSQDRRDEPHPGGALRRAPRVHPRHAPHRSLAGRPVIHTAVTRQRLGSRP